MSGVHLLLTHYPLQRGSLPAMTCHPLHKALPSTHHWNIEDFLLPPAWTWKLGAPSLIPHPSYSLSPAVHPFCTYPWPKWVNSFLSIHHLMFRSSGLCSPCLKLWMPQGQGLCFVAVLWFQQFIQQIGVSITAFVNGKEVKNLKVQRMFRRVWKLPGFWIRGQEDRVQGPSSIL